MPDPVTVRLAAALVALLLCPAAALGQGDRWFRVELLVVSQAGGENLERWDAMPRLTYPDRYRFLLDDSSALQRSDATVAIDEFGRRVVTSHGAAGVPSQDDAEPRDLVQAAAFHTLPAAELSLRGKAAYMERSGRYRVLFHEAWLQPVPAEGRALPLILDRSGDNQQWPALQGWIRLHLSRYLHLETNLWLNTSGDYLPGTWRMPAPPLAPPSVVLVEPTPPATGVNTGVIDPEAGYALVAEPASVDETAVPEDAVADAPAYPFRHAVLLQQKRRMRSGDIHYIDHPMMGVIVRLTPVGARDQQAPGDNSGDSPLP